MWVLCGAEWPCQAACVEDFGAPCPATWAHMQHICIAPETYGGACRRVANLTNMTLRQKQNYGRRCNVKFPCGSGASWDELEATQTGLRGLPNGPLGRGGGLWEGTKNKARNTMQPAAYSGPVE
mmetsp:Transcript_114312/g.319447  ORF Transcript_114312/g.319447 Transcript_114312/m.319447 type:complete len:124 (+) Transcript_114312:2-373(+)